MGLHQDLEAAVREHRAADKLRPQLVELAMSKLAHGLPAFSQGSGSAFIFKHPTNPSESGPTPLQNVLPEVGGTFATALCVRAEGVTFVFFLRFVPGDTNFVLVRLIGREGADWVFTSSDATETPALRSFCERLYSEARAKLEVVGIQEQTKEILVNAPEGEQPSP